MGKLNTLVISLFVQATLLTSLVHTHEIVIDHEDTRSHSEDFSEDTCPIRILVKSGFHSSQLTTEVLVLKQSIIKVYCFHEELKLQYLFWNGLYQRGPPITISYS